MTEVYRYNGAGLYYCSEEEFELIRDSNYDFSYLLCAKNPFHKEFVGYERNCPKGHPEYLVANRPDDRMMALNMVDAPKPEFFADEMIDAGIDFIHSELSAGHDTVVVCNQGESRSPTMCLMYLMAHGDFNRKMSHKEVFAEFMRLAPSWKPNNGILQYCCNFWSKLREEEINGTVC